MREAGASRDSRKAPSLRAARIKHSGGVRQAVLTVLVAAKLTGSHEVLEKDFAGALAETEQARRLPERERQSCHFCVGS